MSALWQSLPFDLDSSLIIELVTLVVLYSIGLIVYRLLFSPLAGFPGPKIAAVTSWYEFYYDFFNSGKYIFEIERMHRKYGW